jgi:hypothetical protein
VPLCPFCPFQAGLLRARREVEKKMKKKKKSLLD